MFNGAIARRQNQARPHPSGDRLRQREFWAWTILASPSAAHLGENAAKCYKLGMALGLQSFRRLALSQTDGAFMVITSYLSAFYRTDLSQLTKFESGFIHGFRRGFEQWVNSLQGVGYRNWERRNGTTWTEVSMSQYSEDQAQQRALEG